MLFNEKDAVLVQCGALCVVHCGAVQFSVLHSVTVCCSFLQLAAVPGASGCVAQRVAVRSNVW